MYVAVFKSLNFGHLQYTLFNFSSFTEILIKRGTKWENQVRKFGNQRSLKDSSHKPVRPIRHNVTASSSGGSSSSNSPARMRHACVEATYKATIMRLLHKAKTWKLRDIRMCRNLFLKRTSRSKQHSSPNEAFSLNNSSEQQSAKQAEHLEQKGAFLRHFCGSILRAIFKVCLCTLGCLSLAIFLSKSVRCEKEPDFYQSV